LTIYPFSHAISLAEVDIYNLRDFVEDNINATDSENLANSITLAAEKLENAIFDISLDKDTESSITSAQNALDRARAEVIALVSKGKISQALATTLLFEIFLIQIKMEDLKNTV
jgi:tRNA G37 N-methylase TrmD